MNSQKNMFPLNHNFTQIFAQFIYHFQDLRCKHNQIEPKWRCGRNWFNLLDLFRSIQTKSSLTFKDSSLWKQNLVKVRCWICGGIEWSDNCCDVAKANPVICCCWTLLQVLLMFELGVTPATRLSRWREDAEEPWCGCVVTGGEVWLSKKMN